MAILLHKAQGIQCNYFRIYRFYPPVHFPLILWLKVRHTYDRIHAEMASISSNITSIKHMMTHQLIE